MQHLRYMSAAVLGAIDAVVFIGAESATEATPALASDITLDESGVRSTESCVSPMDVDYMEALEAQEDTDVYFASCGGFL